MTGSSPGWFRSVALSARSLTSAFSSRQIPDFDPQETDGTELVPMCLPRHTPDAALAVVKMLADRDLSRRVGARARSGTWPILLVGAVAGTVIGNAIGKRGNTDPNCRMFPGGSSSGCSSWPPLRGFISGLIQWCATHGSGGAPGRAAVLRSGGGASRARRPKNTPRFEYFARPATTRALGRSIAGRWHRVGAPPVR